MYFFFQARENLEATLGNNAVYRKASLEQNRKLLSGQLIQNNISLDFIKLTYFLFFFFRPVRIQKHCQGISKATTQYQKRNYTMNRYIEHNVNAKLQRIKTCGNPKLNHDLELVYRYDVAFVYNKIILIGQFSFRQIDSWCTSMIYFIRIIFSDTSFSVLARFFSNLFTGKYSNQGCQN